MEWLRQQKQSMSSKSFGGHVRLDLKYNWSLNERTHLNAGFINLLFWTKPPMDTDITSGLQIDGDIHEVRGSYFFGGFEPDSLVSFKGVEF